MDMYVIIPGFSHYRINRETKEVQSNRQGRKWRNLKIHSCGCYRLISDKKNAYNATPNRLLYAAQRGINPAKMSGDLFVVERDGELCLFDRRAYIVNLWGYLTRVVRTLHANIIKANKLITSLNENRKYAGTI